jgi:formylglycine-generating enzyme required for sulfatase activity
MAKGDMTMRKIIIPIEFIMVMGCLVFSGYAEQHKERITNSLGMEFVLIKPGRFMMGSPKDEPGRYAGETQRKVTLTSPFYLQTTEVTKAQWKELIDKNPSSQKGCGIKCPVEMVSWDDVQEYIKKLNEKEGTNKYRLPTEAEWEYACRAGTSTAFPSGKITELNCELDPNLDPFGWYCFNSGNIIHPVAQKKPNAWGLYDMLGNVQEWCQDQFGPYLSGEVTDPKGPAAGTYRVMRGGTWYSPARDCRCASRFGSPPHYRFRHIGFRLCRTP